MSSSQGLRLYEGMFLVDANRANQDWASVSESIHGVIVRHGGKVEGSEKWDERKTAYPIKGHSRVTYLLVHFQALPSRLKAIQTSYELSDLVLRVLLVQDEDGITSEVRSLSDEPTDPVRSTRRGRNVDVPETSDRSSGGRGRRGRGGSGMRSGGGPSRDRDRGRRAPDASSGAPEEKPAPAE